MSNGTHPHEFAGATNGSVQSGAVPHPCPRRGAILVVEDREDVRQGLAQLLELHGYLVADAGTGEDGQRQLTNDPDAFALILLDLILPGNVSGRDLRAQQLADPAIASIPTIVVTASELDARDRACLRPDALLEKPFRFDDLLGLVKRYVTPEGSVVSAG
jgi:CheY-like chemotaxis protein